MKNLQYFLYNTTKTKHLNKKISKKNLLEFKANNNKEYKIKVI